MEKSVSDVNEYAKKAQQKIFEMLAKEIELFEVIDGNLNPEQAYARRFSVIQQKMNEIISSIYAPYIANYLDQYDHIEATTKKLQLDYNKIEVSENLINPSKKVFYEQAKYYLTSGLADAYVQPAKFMLMQHVVRGDNIKKMRSTLENWDKGQLKPGTLASDIKAPRLQAYSTQIARDTMYSYQGAVQGVISKEYGLSHFIYVGGLVADSRPFCKHLVGLNRKVSFEEIPPLVIAYPDGLRPGTTKDNFLQVRGGFNCNHVAMAVKG